MESITRIIVIDDDPINNLICRQTIKNTNADIEVVTFTLPEKGLEYIKNGYDSSHRDMNTIIFLDINMPTWSGWEFLDNFENLDETIKKQFNVYMLSSSVSPLDIERASENKNVVDYVKKPLKKTVLLNIFS